MRPLLALGVALLAAPTVAAAGFHAEGSFLVASPVAYFVMDACAHRLTDGIDSSCIAIPAWTRGLAYAVSFQTTGVAAVGDVCFYDDVQWISCHTGPHGEIPLGTTYASFSSFVGGPTSWTFDV